MIWLRGDRSRRYGNCVYRWWRDYICTETDARKSCGMLLVVFIFLSSIHHWIVSCSSSGAALCQLGRPCWERRATKTSGRCPQDQLTPCRSACSTPQIELDNCFSLTVKKKTKNNTQTLKRKKRNISAKNPHPLFYEPELEERASRYFRITSWPYTQNVTIIIVSVPVPSFFFFICTFVWIVSDFFFLPISPLRLNDLIFFCFFFRIFFMRARAPTKWRLYLVGGRSF